jgi:hypothetical protein
MQVNRVLERRENRILLIIIINRENAIPFSLEMNEVGEKKKSQK